MKATRTNRPTIKFYYSEQLKDNDVLQQILYGAEEEGIPIDMQKVPEENVLEMAHRASRDSVLGTGIGVSSSYAAVHYEKLPVDRPVYLVRLDEGDEAVRRTGVNGARLVKRMPLKMKKDV